VNNFGCRDYVEMITNHVKIFEEEEKCEIKLKENEKFKKRLQK
jgi:hypothetical protein